MGRVTSEGRGYFLGRAASIPAGPPERDFRLKLHAEKGERKKGNAINFGAMAGSPSPGDVPSYRAASGAEK